MIVTADDFIAFEKLVNNDHPALRLQYDQSLPIFEELTSQVMPHLAITDAGGAVEWFAMKYRIRAELGTGKHGAVADSLRRMANLVSKYWKPAGAHPQKALTFIKNTELRHIAEDDWNRAIGAAQREDAKAAAISAGNVVEAVTLDALEALTDAQFKSLRKKLDSLEPARRRSIDFKEPSLEKWRFIQFILATGPIGMGMLTERTHDLGHMLRDWRNLVHPAASRKKKDPLLPSEGRLAIGLAESVIEDAEAWVNRGRPLPPL
ncbi:hypothetical protein HJC22_18230 [Corallococcus exiguus]|uniref:hypothetical protein n=1 Tax=Corallococcus exiguus TaxID=83462 RepID=UPI001471062C|nr:hypothetical protein [Corallococcus exiguus]NNC17659.1 hypothetical protein [Corallococcus exiguus]